MLTILYFLFQCCVFVNCNFSFLAYDYDYESYYCVTNSSSALVWTKQEDRTSTFIPPTEKLNITSYVNTEHSKLIWAAILDRRWEGLVKNQISPYDNSQNPLRIKYSVPKEDRFKITFSVRTEYEASIFLCNDDDYLDCYWLLFKNNSAVMLQKCLVDNVSSIWNSYCNMTSELDIQNVTTTKLNGELWTHYEIIKETKQFILQKRIGSRRELRLKFLDNIPINVKNVLVGSTSVYSYWKFHVKKPQVYTETAANMPIVRVEFPISNRSVICINFFVMMCLKCQLKLALFNISNPHSPIKLSNRTYSFPEIKSEQWSEVTYYYNDTKEILQNIVVILSTAETNQKNMNNFWAVDDIRSCSSNEFRVISSNHETKCQIMTADYDETAVLEQTNLSTSGPSTVVDCSRLMNIPCVWNKDHHCGKTRICHNNKFNEISCCLICPNKQLRTNTYITEIDFKSITISNTSLTLIMSNKTSTTLPESFKITLSSNGTDVDKSVNKTNLIRFNNLIPFTNYTVKLFNFTRNIRTFEGVPDQIKNLSVCSISPDSIGLKWEKPVNIYGDLKYYVVKYQHLSYAACTSRFSNFTSNFVRVKDLFVNLTGLIPYSNYIISVTVENSNFTSNSTTLLCSTSEVLEKPQEKELPEVSIDVGPSFAVIHFPPVKCFLLLGKLFINLTATCHNTTQNYNFTYPLNTDVYKFTNLTPFQNYTLHINFCRRPKLCSQKIYNFTTRETIPQKVEISLTRIINATSILLCWTEPSPPTGIIELYNISYSTCDDKIATKENHITLKNNTCATLTHLIENRIYCVKIKTKNKNIDDLSEETVIKVVTIKGASIYNKEIVVTIIIFALLVLILLLSKTIKQTIISKLNLGGQSEIENTDIPLIDLTNEPRHYINGYGDSDYNNRIVIKQFEKYVKDCVKTAIFLEQHEAILSSAEETKYEIIDTDLFWSYVDSHPDQDRRIEKAYIVTEMPNNKNMEEFWKIVWDEDVKNMIFISSVNNLHNFTSKEFFQNSDSFLVSQNKNVLHGLFYEEVSLKLCFNQQYKEVNLIHFHSWPKFGVPNSYLFTPILQKLLKIPLNSNSPLLVVSKSGLDASGLFLLCNMCLRNIQNETIDVINCTYFLATCNLNLVNNCEIYILAHLVILENLKSSKSTINVIDFNCQVPTVPSPEEIQNHWDSLNELLWIDQTIKVLQENANNSESENEENNHYDYADTLNPVTVDGNCTKFISVQQPTQFSLHNFWKMVLEQNVLRIISLNKVVSKKEQWWPSYRRQVISISETFKIKYEKTVKLRGFIWITARLEEKEMRQIKLVEIFLVENWSATNSNRCPDNVADFVSFYDKSSKIWKNVSPILVICGDGRSACGLFIALSLILESINNGCLCNVHSCVRKLKFHHPEFLKNKKQFFFLWKAVGNYLKEKKLYL